MSGQQNSRAEALLAAVSKTQDELSALEQSYKAAKEETQAALAAHLNRLAESADTIAVRAHVLRELYWNKRVPIRQIAKVFGLKQGEVRTIAGRMALTSPCRQGSCINHAKLSFGSVTELVAFEKSLEEQAGDHSRVRCEECRARERRLEEEGERRRAAEQRHRAEEQFRRAEGLATLPWAEFIETPEWVEGRNLAISKAGYGCELCETYEVSLYVYLHKNAPQYSTDLWFTLRSHLRVLCAGCVSRCEGLLEEQKYELVKKEFLDHVRAWVRENVSSDY